MNKKKATKTLDSHSPEEENGEDSSLTYGEVIAVDEWLAKRTLKSLKEQSVAQAHKACELSTGINMPQFEFEKVVGAHKREIVFLKKPPRVSPEPIMERKMVEMAKAIRQIASEKKVELFNAESIDAIIHHRKMPVRPADEET